MKAYKNFQQLFANRPIIDYKKHALVFSPQNPPQGVYRINKGFLYSYTIAPKKNKHVLLILEPGNVFPILQNTLQSSFRFYIEALTNVQITRIESEIFFKAIYNAKGLTHEFIKQMSLYLSTYTNRLENLEMVTTEQRVLSHLLFFTLRFGERQNNGHIFIKVPLTHEFIAQSINVSRSNVSRVLERLRKDNIIAFEGKNMIVLQEKKLTAYIQSPLS